ncbi:MAG TPA: hypothetical protein PLN21_13655 [Gemmatales bacterium]|nr:hypothetical protein [Gemmatales bacterium]
MSIIGTVPSPLKIRYAFGSEYFPLRNIVTHEKYFLEHHQGGAIMLVFLASVNDGLIYGLNWRFLYQFFHELWEEVKVDDTIRKPHFAFVLWEKVDLGSQVTQWLTDIQVNYPVLTLTHQEIGSPNTFEGLFDSYEAYSGGSGGWKPGDWFDGFNHFDTMTASLPIAVFIDVGYRICTSYSFTQDDMWDLIKKTGRHDILRQQLHETWRGCNMIHDAGIRVPHGPIISQILFGGTGDGGGKGITPGGIPKPIDPWGPFEKMNRAERDLLYHLAQLQLSSGLSNPEDRAAIAGQTLEMMWKAVEKIQRERMVPNNKLSVSKRIEEIREKAARNEQG